MSKPIITGILEALDNSITISQGIIRIADPVKLREKVRVLAEFSALGAKQEQGLARYLTRIAAQQLGIFPASIQALYMARGRGEVPANFTVPALNLRVLAFDCARALFAAARQAKAGAFICELARSEMGFTDQRAAEYTTSILCGAIAEGYRGPVFIQGDHFQVSAKRYRQNPDVEVEGLRNLIRESVSAGFYNIDVDTSTLVDLNQPTVLGQQVLNTQLSALFTTYIRSVQPPGVTIAIGGEIGEVGGRNSTEEELRAYLDGLRDELNNTGFDAISKVSIQTGTAHGGVVLPDGSLAAVKVDFDTMLRLSRLARSEYGMGGAVQHGASTLTDKMLGKFPGAEALEIHLATQVMNTFYDRIPDNLRAEIHAFIHQKYDAERQPDLTEEQFIYKNRKLVLGHFKRDSWNLAEDLREQMRQAWLEQFLNYFTLLGVNDTRAMVDRYARPADLRPELAFFTGEPTANVEDIVDLAD